MISKHQTIDYFKRLSARLRGILDNPYELFYLQDLSHCLRLICDAKEEIASSSDFREILLPAWKPTHSLRRIFKSHPYLITYFHRPVPIPNPPEKDMSIGVGLPKVFFPKTPGYGIYGTMRIRSGFLDMDRLIIGYTTGTPQFIDPYTQIQKKPIGEWLESSLVDLQWINPEGNKKRFNFSREKFIRRVANAFGGSHPIGGADKTDENQIIQFLIEKHIGGFPVPYILLYGTAYELLVDACPCLGAFLEKPRRVEPK